ncbi:Ubiquitin carboxyl-terminal hydrolase [Mycena indigotica]|uniref:Ubiquitin carboxyl-terminal hydrolase n=1 Tax=Mycena indigotica TaxID=2126181 RepID=A0A8H6VZ14_9AGAR|nr:Ubiquitin carboxyl-terminal hydrolase [Mycena indigotica]KAF7295503.1 Ubiquitin carboxyl-terminal hydrolase [Mycena indigotica]
MSCSHLSTLASLQAPRLSQSVHREECTQCFDNQDDPLGVDVCLSCFNGGCSGDRHHIRTHLQKSGHRFTLNVKRKLKPSTKRVEDEEPPAKISKLAIPEEKEEDKYDHSTVVKCWTCDVEKGREIPEAFNDAKVKSLADEVMRSLSSARQSEVKAWEEEFEACEHTLMLQQVSAGAIPASGLAHCTACELTNNLWLCLTCGSLGCGRPLYGVANAGNGHGVRHYEETGHPVSVKLGTITPEGGADIFCYKCDDAKLDPDLPLHLSTFGINISTAQKTEKSMTEMQIEHNLKYDFSLTSEDGKALEPVFGAGLTGLSNLGNSCYMASVLQTLFSLPGFKTRYFSATSTTDHASQCPEQLPADCVECQMRKVADGLLSGRYSHPGHGASTSANDPVFQEGLRPAGFKALIGKGHSEFSTMKQQDSEEFLGHLLTVLRRDAHKYKDRAAGDMTTVFTYGLEQRLECNVCSKVSYRVDSTDVLSVPVTAIEQGKDADGKIIYSPITLESCVDTVLTPELLEYSCPSCNKSVHASKQAKFATFPEVLVVHAKKFQLVNWVPTKLDIPLILPEGDALVFGTQHLGTGLQAGEVELPSVAAAAAVPEFNVAAMAQLEGMGFSTLRSQKALLATGNSDAEAAMEWLFVHLEDPDIDAPVQHSAGGGAGPEPSPEQISMLTDMGFNAAQAKKALRETSGNTERAVEWLFNHPDDMDLDDGPAATSSVPAEPAVVPGSKSVPVQYRLKAFISHKGPSVHSGHYVAHIQTPEGWVLFNDEKVVKADAESVKELKKLAYLYVFERV